MLRLYRRLISNAVQKRHLQLTTEQSRIITQLSRNYGDGNYKHAPFTARRLGFSINSLHCDFRWKIQIRNQWRSTWWQTLVFRCTSYYTTRKHVDTIIDSNKANLYSFHCYVLRWLCRILEYWMQCCHIWPATMATHIQGRINMVGNPKKLLKRHANK